MQRLDVHFQVALQCFQYGRAFLVLCFRRVLDRVLLEKPGKRTQISRHLGDIIFTIFNHRVTSLICIKGYAVTHIFKLFASSSRWL